MQRRAKFVDGAAARVADQRSIGPHGRAPAPLEIPNLGADLHIAGFHQRTEGDAWCSGIGLHRLEHRFVERQGRVDPLLRDIDIGFFALQPDEVAAQPLGHRAGRAGAEERIDNDVAGLRAGQKNAIKQGFRLLRRVGLGAVLLDAFLPAANREGPVRPHLQFVVQRLHRAVVERVFRVLALRCPDQRFMRVGEARALEIGHRVDLAPDDVVEDPEAFILQDGANAEDVVVAADDPERAIGLQDAAGFGEPGARKLVIGFQAVKLVPVIVDGIDTAAFRAEQVATQLEVIGRIGKDHVDAGVGQRAHICDAIAHDDLVQRQLNSNCRRLPDLLQNPHCVTPFSAQNAGGESSRVPRQPLESGLNP